MENPVKEVKKAFPTGRVVLTTLFCIIAINFVVDAIANFVPGVGTMIAGFITRPFSFIKAKVSPPAS